MFLQYSSANQKLQNRSNACSAKIVPYLYYQYSKIHEITFILKKIYISSFINKFVILENLFLQIYSDHCKSIKHPNGFGRHCMSPQDRFRQYQRSQKTDKNWWRWVCIRLARQWYRYKRSLLSQIYLWLSPLLTATALPLFQCIQGAACQIWC